MTTQLIVDVIFAVLLAITTRSIRKVEHQTNSMTENLVALARKLGLKEGRDQEREDQRIIDAGSEKKP